MQLLMLMQLRRWLLLLRRWLLLLRRWLLLLMLLLQQLMLMRRRWLLPQSCNRSALQLCIDRNMLRTPPRLRELLLRRTEWEGRWIARSRDRAWCHVAFPFSHVMFMFLIGMLLVRESSVFLLSLTARSLCRYINQTGDEPQTQDTQ